MNSPGYGLDVRLANMVGRGGTFLTSRRLAVASVTFVLFVLFDLVLFGWMISKSLSQREIEKVLLETREEAEPVARELEAKAEEHGDDLFVVMSVAQETRTYLENVLSKREVVRKVEVRDRNGTVVFGPHWSEEEVPLEPTAVPRVETGTRSSDTIALPNGTVLDTVEVPIGDVGTLVIGLSEKEVQKRIGILRQDLIRQASLIGLVTMALLLVAFAAVWKLFFRARDLEEQAQEAERMAYIGTLASGLAHEIRSPLNSLSLNMQMLEEEARESGSSGSQLRLLSLTRSELGRLERLATDFLSYARPRDTDLEKLPAGVLLERAAAVLSGETQEKAVVLEVLDRSRGALVAVDREQMSQLLLNLAQNAVAAAIETGLGRPEVKLTARREGPELVLEVEDNGPGIPLEEQEKIFELFYSTRKGGTGLGLAIVQRIAKGHGSEIEIDSREGQGTVMRFRLPIIGESMVAAPVLPEAVSSWS